jgi:hypothetical protein
MEGDGGEWGVAMRRGVGSEVDGVERRWGHERHGVGVDDARAPTSECRLQALPQMLPHQFLYHSRAVEVEGLVITKYRVVSS